MKLRQLHIENYKMFKDFDISFVDEHDEALPIIVLAGVNGSGKTTLLDFINECIYFNNDETENYIEGQIPSHENFIKIAHNHSPYGLTAVYKGNHEHKMITYFSVNQNISTLKEFLPGYIEEMVYEEKIPPNEVYKQIRDDINDILEELNPQIEFDSRDGKGNLFFRNKNGGDKFSIDKLSTGEKTLMSKVLYMYIEDIQNQVILIDEPELSLHPSWQNKVLAIYKNFAIENNCQIIIATHSPHIIGSAKSEYIRLLVKEGDSVKVVDNFHNTYGLKFSQILTEVMGVEYLRPVEVEKQLSKVKSMIVQNEYDSDAFKQEWSELEKLLGEDYLELKLLKVEIASRRKNVSSK